MDKKNIMFLGTASSVGKSTIAAALCRCLVNEGFNVAPFKALNISLNSFVTKDNLEMGRAQVVQAEACKIEPSVLMNPILLKPGGSVTQVIVEGKVYSVIEPYKYKELNEELKVRAKQSYDKLKKKYDVIVMEGSGSCAEINLKDSDIANMYMAKKTGAPVILVADIDRGGVFASIVGTLKLLEPSERKLVKGIIINKFRGNKVMFEDAVKQLEEIIKIPVLGVMPYEKFYIEDEDGVTESIKDNEKEGCLDIAIIRFSHMSNFTDFSNIDNFENVNVRYVDSAERLKNPDIIILPGTKNTIEDLRIIKENHLFEKIIEQKEKGVFIFGICGGYQMLGAVVLDKLGVEGKISEEPGFGFLNMKTRFNENKVTKQTTAKILCDLENVKNICGVDVTGYEIHNGISKLGKNTIPFVKDNEGNVIGVCNENKTVAGTYLHGLFDSEEFVELFINSLMKNNEKLKSSKAKLKIKDMDKYDKLAMCFKENVNLNAIKNIMKL